MTIFVRFMSCILALLATACSQINLGIVNFPTHFDDVRLVRDVSFGPDAWQKLDIYVPSHATKEKPLPVIVFYYGGRWSEGSKDDYKFVGSALAGQDFIVVIPDYRKYPEVKFPAFIEDAAQSLAWTYDHIAEYGGLPDAIDVAGHSAGAHIGALLTTDARYLQAQGKRRSDVIRHFVGLAGPYDFEPYEPDLIDMFGPPEKYDQMQVPTFIDGQQPPMLLLWGDQDIHVGQFNMDQLAAKIAEKGGCVKTKIYRGLDHIWIVANLSWLGRKKSEILGDWTDFVRQDDC